MPPPPPPPLWSSKQLEYCGPKNVYNLGEPLKSAKGSASLVARSSFHFTKKGPFSVLKASYCSKPPKPGTGKWISVRASLLAGSSFLAIVAKFLQLTERWDFSDAHNSLFLHIILHGISLNQLVWMERELLQWEARDNTSRCFVIFFLLN